jgi:hypothetical protein
MVEQFHFTSEVKVCAESLAVMVITGHKSSCKHACCRPVSTSPLPAMIAVAATSFCVSGLKTETIDAHCRAPTQLGDVLFHDEKLVVQFIQVAPHPVDKRPTLFYPRDSREFARKN